MNNDRSDLLDELKNTPQGGRGGACGRCHLLPPVGPNRRSDDTPWGPGIAPRGGFVVQAPFLSFRLSAWWQRARLEPRGIADWMVNLHLETARCRGNVRQLWPTASDSM